MEDNSEEVKIGKAIHEERNNRENTELAIENIRLDKLTGEYLTELKNLMQTCGGKMAAPLLFKSFERKRDREKRKVRVCRKEQNRKKDCTFRIDRR